MNGHPDYALSDAVGKTGLELACEPDLRGQNGKKEITSITLDPAIVDPDDIETLTDLITAAVNEGIGKVTKTNDEEKEKLSSQMNIPGVF